MTDEMLNKEVAERKKNEERARMILIRELLNFSDKHPECADVVQEILPGLMTTGNNISSSDFVRGYLKVNNIHVNPSGVFIGNDPIKNIKAFTHTVYQTWKAFKKRHKIRDNLSREDITGELEWMLEKQWVDKRDELRQSLEPSSNFVRFDQLLRTLARALVGIRYNNEESIEFRRALAFLAHFVWHAQMKLHHGAKSTLQSGHEAVLLLVSRQQKTGKSTTVRKLVEPFAQHDFVWKTDFARLEDSFSIQNLAYNYIAWFDDAARSTIKNMEKFKQVITEDEINFRVMYSQSERRMPKLCSFIATSNKPAQGLMNDTTGMRRFHQIDVNPNSVATGGGIDLKVIDQFPIHELYQTVPLSNESPMFLYITQEELEAYENEMRPRHMVEHWLRAMDYKLAQYGEGEVLPGADLYQSFRSWAMENGYGQGYIPNSVSFGRTIVELGGMKDRTSNFRGYRIIKEDTNE